MILPAIVLATVVSVQAPEETKTLIVPIYFQSHPLYTTMDVTEVLGRHFELEVEEFRSDGIQTVSKHFPKQLQPYLWQSVSPSFFIAGLQINNGWARIIYPANRSVRAVATMVNRNDPEISTQFAVIPPAQSFRIIVTAHWHGEQARYEPRVETAIVIVNPTEEDQAVSLVFYGRGRGKDNVIQQEVEIKPMHSLSQFMTELMPQVLNYAKDGHIKGILKVTGKTVISVGALDFFRDSGRFRGVPATATQEEEAP